MHPKFGFGDEGLFKARHDVYRLAFFADTWRDTKDEIQAKVSPR